jgi:hypothetical protein
MANELPTDFTKFPAQKGLPARKAQVLDTTKGTRKGKEFIFREVILPIEVAPVKAMVALHVADGIDEQDQERGAGEILEVF